MSVAIASWLRSLPAVVIGLTLLTSCNRSPKITDNSAIGVELGRGVTNVCEVGMTFAQVKRATRDATIHALTEDAWIWNRWEHGQVVFVPSLGAISYLAADGPLTEISFKVRSTMVMPNLPVDQPFRGKLANALAFDGGPVTRTEVEAQFGPADRSATNITEAFGLRKRSRSFDWKDSAGRELLWYPTKGVAFEFESNIMTSFQVYKAIGTNR